jgi:outer membrane protein OmpA-like peptidoglycan-associated protein
MGATKKKKLLTGKGKGSLFLWLFLASLFLSLLFHAIFFRKAESWKVMGFSPEGYDKIVPRTFRMKRVEIDPKTLEEPAPTPRKKEPPQPVAVEKESPQIPTAQEGASKEMILTKPVEMEIQEKPGVSQGEISALMKKGEKGIMETSIDIPEPKQAQQPLAGIEEKVANERSVTGRGMEPRFSSLDDLLAGGAQVTPATAPILMPTDLLFEYDSSTLKPEAAASLAKLGKLIARNSGSTFRIEGHTDSFGSDDYNTALSRRRAEEVRGWLQKSAGIPPGRITTAGLGKSRLLVPATGSVAEQQLNRRVEIVITATQP